MSFLLITIPVSLLLAATLLGLVIAAVRRGDFDDFDGPAERHHLDDDHCPETAADAAPEPPAAAAPVGPQGR